MIPYEELVAALDRFVARNGGTPQSVRGPGASYSSAPAEDVPMGGFDEPRDPDMPSLAGRGGEEDSTHVGSSPLGSPIPSQPSGDDHSNEIDIGDVLADDELN